MKGLKKMTTKLFWKIRIWKSLEPLLFSMMIPMLSFNILNLDFGYPTKPIKYVFSFSYLLSCSTDQTTNSESTNPEF